MHLLVLLTLLVCGETTLALAADPVWVNEDFGELAGPLPAGWVNGAAGSGKLVTGGGALTPLTPHRVYHSTDIPVAIAGDFHLEMKFSCHYNPAIQKGRLAFGNLGLQFLREKGRPSTKEPAFLFWQDVTNWNWLGGNGFITIKGAVEDASTATRPVLASGEGDRHTARIERTGINYVLTVDDTTLYTGTLGESRDQNFVGVRIGLLGGFGGAREAPIANQLHSITIGPLAKPAKK